MAAVVCCRLTPAHGPTAPPQMSLVCRAVSDNDALMCGWLRIRVGMWLRTSNYPPPPLPMARAKILLSRKGGHDSSFRVGGHWLPVASKIFKKLACEHFLASASC